jgi:hypothetical protein
MDNDILSWLGFRPPKIFVWVAKENILSVIGIAPAIIRAIPSSPAFLSETVPCNSTYLPSHFCLYSMYSMSPLSVSGRLPGVSYLAFILFHISYIDYICRWPWIQDSYCTISTTIQAYVPRCLSYALIESLVDNAVVLHCCNHGLFLSTTSELPAPCPRCCRPSRQRDSERGQKKCDSGTPTASNKALSQACSCRGELDRAVTDV